MSEKLPPTISDVTPLAPSAQPSCRWTKASASPSSSILRPSPVATDRTIASYAGLPRPIVATGVPRRNRDRVDIERDGDVGQRHHRVGGEIMRAEQPLSSAVVARKSGTSRSGRGPAASRLATSISTAIPLALSTAPLQMRSASASPFRRCPDGPNGRGTALPCRRPRARQLGDDIVAGKGAGCRLRRQIGGDRQRRALVIGRFRRRAQRRAVLSRLFEQRVGGGGRQKAAHRCARRGARQPHRCCPRCRAAGPTAPRRSRSQHRRGAACRRAAAAVRESAAACRRTARCRTARSPACLDVGIDLSRAVDAIADKRGRQIGERHRRIAAAQDNAVVGDRDIAAADLNLAAPPSALVSTKGTGCNHGVALPGTASSPALAHSPTI